jgi:hypothetical protein
MSPWLQVLPFIIALGLYTRVALLLEFFCFTHIFIVCESNHNNHYVLFCYALALAPFTCMDASLSLDAVLFHRRHPKAGAHTPPSPFSST